MAFSIGIKFQMVLRGSAKAISTIGILPRCLTLSTPPKSPRTARKLLPYRHGSLLQSRLQRLELQFLTAEGYANIDPLLRPIQELVENDAHQAQKADADAEADFEDDQLRAWNEIMEDFWKTRFAEDEEAEENDRPQVAR